MSASGSDEAPSVTSFTLDLSEAEEREKEIGRFEEQSWKAPAVPLTRWLDPPLILVTPMSQQFCTPSTKGLSPPSPLHSWTRYCTPRVGGT